MCAFWPPPATGWQSGCIRGSFARISTFRITSYNVCYTKLLRGFDWLYEQLFVKPYRGLVWLLGADPCNQALYLPARLAEAGNRLLALSQNGYLRWYLASMSLGALLVLALLVMV